MKKTLFILAVLMATAFASHAQLRINADVVLGRRTPNPNELRVMRAEEARHPNIAQAIRNVQESIRLLQNAPDTYGGHKGQAMGDLQRALVSLRKALYYRIYVERR